MKFSGCLDNLEWRISSVTQEPSRHGWPKLTVYLVCVGDESRTAQFDMALMDLKTMDDLRLRPKPAVIDPGE
jgi:hypothetical protein